MLDAHIFNPFAVSWTTVLLTIADDDAMSLPNFETEVECIVFRTNPWTILSTGHASMAFDSLTMRCDALTRHSKCIPPPRKPPHKPLVSSHLYLFPFDVCFTMSLHTNECISPPRKPLHKPIASSHPYLFPFDVCFTVSLHTKKLWGASLLQRNLPKFGRWEFVWQVDVNFVL